MFLVPLLITSCALAILGNSWPRLRGTTLRGPWCWCAASFVVIGSVLSFLAWRGDSATWSLGLRFAAVTTSYCPLMSLLGAKRPQDKAWHLIVFSLWIVLALPAAENLVLRPGQPLDVQGARSWFLLALLSLNLVTGFPTRYRISWLLAACGQALMLADFLPWPAGRSPAAAPLAGFGLCVIAMAAAASAKRGVAHSPLDFVWLDFRDSFGALWGLRIQERINAAAQINQWPLVLEWEGFRSQSGEPISSKDIPPELRQSLRQTFANLLRRFVSRDWLSQRIEESVD